MSVFYVELENLSPNPDNRKLRGNAVQELVDNFNPKKLTPLYVKEEGKDKFMIMDGHHRYYASLKLSINRLPCIHVDNAPKRVFMPNEPSIPQIIKARKEHREKILRDFQKHNNVEESIK